MGRTSSPQWFASSDNSQEREEEKDEEEEEEDRHRRRARLARDCVLLDFEQSVVLGAGASGSVTRAVHQRSGEVFALKAIERHKISDHNLQTYIQREVETQRSLRHPNIVRLYDSFEEKSSIYLVLEYMPNGQLFHYVRQRRWLQEAEAAVLLRDVLSALGYLHKQGIVHRDLKAENVLLDQRGRAKLADFGWCAELVAGGRRTFCGTVDYLSPEMIEGEPHDHNVDIWAAGILLYEMLVGESPFAAKSQFLTMERIQACDLHIPASVSAGARELIEGFIRREPTERLSIAEALAKPWLNRYSGVAEQPLSPGRSVRLPRSPRLAESPRRQREPKSAPEPDSLPSPPTAKSQGSSGPALDVYGSWTPPTLAPRKAAPRPAPVPAACTDAPPVPQSSGPSVAFAWARQSDSLRSSDSHARDAASHRHHVLEGSWASASKPTELAQAPCAGPASRCRDHARVPPSAEGKSARLGSKVQPSRTERGSFILGTCLVPAGTMVSASDPHSIAAQQCRREPRPAEEGANQRSRPQQRRDASPVVPVLNLAQTTARDYSSWRETDTYRAVQNFARNDGGAGALEKHLDRCLTPRRAAALATVSQHGASPVFGESRARHITGRQEDLDDVMLTTGDRDTTSSRRSWGSSWSESDLGAGVGADELTDTDPADGLLASFPGVKRMFGLS